MDRPTRRRLFNRANPLEALAPDDPRCVDLTASRPRRLRERLRAEIVLSDAPTTQYLCAPKGAGVSTFLRALEGDLATECTVRRIDLSTSLDLSSPIDLPELLLSLVDGAARALLSPSDAPPFIARFWDALRSVEPSLSRPEFNVADPRDLLSELSLRPALREHTRAITASRLGELVREARDELSLLDAHCRARREGPLVLLCDSLEALRPPAHAFRETLQRAESVLARLGALALPVHLLVTAPLALITRPMSFSVLPLLPVDTDAGARDAREILARRLPDGAFGEVFAPDIEGRAARLAQATGGSPAALVQAAQSLLTEPELPLSDADFERFLGDFTDAVLRQPPSGDLPWLARVAATGTLSLTDAADRDRADLALSHGVVQCLGAGRFAVHPCLAPRLRALAEG